MFKKMMAH